MNEIDTGSFFLSLFEIQDLDSDYFGSSSNGSGV
jgi:hypothetical protein